MTVTSPDPHAAGSTLHAQWWVVQSITAGKGGGVSIWSAIQSPAKPKNTVAGPFNTQSQANQVVNQHNGGGINLPNPLGIVSGWLTSMGGSIASGIEAGFVAWIKDLWNVVVGPLEILLGVLIGMWVLVIYFKDDIMRGVSMLGGMAMAV